MLQHWSTEAFGETYHVVKAGDSLSKIALTFYKDPFAWPYIAEANREALKGSKYLQIGTKLMIPELPKDKTSQKEGFKLIELVTGNEYAPFTDERLPNGGMITEIVARVFRGMGYDPKIEFWNWDHGYRSTEKGVFAATFPYLKTSERQVKYLYSKPVYEILIVPFVRKDSKIAYSSPDDLKNYRICKPKGYAVPTVDEMIKNGSLSNVEEPKQMSDCFKMLEAKQVDIVPEMELSGKELVFNLGLESSIHSLENAVDISTLHIIFPKYVSESNVTLYKFNQSLKNLKGSGAYEKIIRIHLENYYNSLK